MTQRPFKRRRCRNTPKPTHDFDLETSLIAAGETPVPSFITLKFEDTGEEVATRLHGYADLATFLRTYMLTEERAKHRYCAYNGNRFDFMLVAYVLRDDPDYIIEPWYARNMALRGMQIKRAANKKMTWTFSDPIAMFAFAGTLEQFVSTYAPDEAKTHIGLAEGISFDPDNSEHVAYAINDTRILQAARHGAEKALFEVTGMLPDNTIGKHAIKFFQRNMPKGVNVWNVPLSAAELLQLAKRGGYVYCPQRYWGPLWGYDINQSFAHQMRKPLPCGSAVYEKQLPPDATKLWLGEAIIQRTAESPDIPFYAAPTTGDSRPIYIEDYEPHTVSLISPEYTWLIAHHWKVDVVYCWWWSHSFDMSLMVDKLEYTRKTAPGGPKGPVGLMVKAIGCNAYGKTSEEMDGIRIVISGEKPSGYSDYMPEQPGWEHHYVKREEPKKADYQKLQIAVFITAYARLQLMDAMTLGSVIAADTDGVKYSQPMDDKLDLDSSRYGAWKVEGEPGEEWIAIAKKCYATTREDSAHPGYPAKLSVKGLHQREVTVEQIVAWFHGNPPVQQQVQRQNFMKMLANAPMFVERERRGSTPAPQEGASP